MEAKVKQVTSWERAYEAALFTVGKRPVKGVTDEWKDKMLMAEHSPIRLVEYDIYLQDIPSFVATHLVRHHMGCEKFVVTNREDRRNINPEEVNRLTPVDMMMTCNAQALINISRKRLCTCASKETREVWQAVKNAIAEIDPIMAKHMVRECEYRNMCPEIKGCGWYEVKKGKEIHEGFMEGLYRLIDNPQKELDRSRFAAIDAFEKERKQMTDIDIDLENELRLNYERYLTSFGHNDFNKAERKNEYNWDLPKSMFYVDRVAFNKCKTSRKRKGLDCMLATFQSSYERNQGEIKTTNKKHHGFVIAHTIDRGLTVICDDAKLRFVKESDVVYL